MKIFSRYTITGALISVVLLGAHALYFNEMKVALADALLWLALVAIWGYMIRQARTDKSQSDHHDGRFLQDTSAFHVQLGHEISDQLSSAHTELGNTQAILSDAIGKLVSNFITISDEVRNLSEGTNKFSRQIHGLMGEVQELLVEAERSIQGLGASDRELVAGCKTHVKDMIDGLKTFNDTVSQNAVELNLVSTKIEQNVLVVISTLQFQDMSTQLIEHARMRMSALQEVANEMGKGGENRDNREYLDRIAAYNRLLDKHVVSLDKQKANPVAQKNFGTGDVELF